MTADGSTTSGTHRVVVTAGHVDHGKSTLLRALTGMEPDRLEAERRRGLTLDLGFVWTTLPAYADGTGDGAEVGGGVGGGDSGGVTVAFVDVPGHERFVATMLAGAGAAPFALPVVAADDGWSRQSAEHRDVLAVLGIPAVALVVAKAGLVDETRVEEVRAEVVRETAGTSLAGAPIVVTDAPSGRGLDELRAVLAQRLVGAPPAPDVGRPRLWVDRAFAVRGTGTVVTGTLAGGSLAVGDAVVVLPAGRRARVRGLHQLGSAVDRAAAGTRVAVALSGVEHTEVARGDALVGADHGWVTTDVVDLWVRALPGRTVGRTGAWHLHVGTADIPVRLLPLLDPVAGDGTPPEGAVRALLDRPLPLAVGDRMVLRDAGRRAVAAGARVVEPEPADRPRGRAARQARTVALAAVAGATPSERAARLATLRGGAARADALLAASGRSRTDAPPDGLVAVGPYLLTEARYATVVASVDGLGPGVHGRRAVRAALGDEQVDDDLAGAVVEHLLRTGDLVRVAGGVSPAAHADAAEVARHRRRDALLAALLAAPLSPPDLDTTARALGMDHREVAALVQSGAVVRCGPVAFAREAVADAIAALRDLAGDGREFGASQAKEAWGTTRRFAIPLLEHLDRTGVTISDAAGRRRLRPASRTESP